jgi:hypothetical protein
MANPRPAKWYKNIPCCPHCHAFFDTWPLAKIHVKRCDFGPNSRHRKERDLACAFCGERKPDFASLSLHVRTECPGGMGLVVKSNEQEESDEMKLPENVMNGRTAKGHDFLRVKHLEKGKDTLATIVDFGEASVKMPYSDYALDLQIGKRVYTQGFRSFSEDLQALGKAYGDETNDWKGKQVILRVGDYENSEGKTSEIVVVRPATAKRSK